jgi:hypothetical protein
MVATGQGHGQVPDFLGENKEETMALVPWYKAVNPREDLRGGKPLDASEFAAHLDQVRSKRAHEVYQNPKLFFERTFLTKNLTSLAGEVVKRLSGDRTETSAVFNMTTQFGGGKTHALMLLYHLATQGEAARSFKGVNDVLGKAGTSALPRADTAVFVGTEFDSMTGRGGDDGTPRRMTPWGDIAYQLGGVEAFNKIEKHDKEGIAPGGDVIRSFIPEDRPCLILMDELMNYVSRNRRSDLSSQLYSFLQSLSEESRARNNMVLAVSIPASLMELSSDDQSDYDRYKKVLDRLGKPIIIAVEGETTEIIRRRLFEWQGVPSDARRTIKAYSDWIIEHRNQIAGIDPDHALDAFTSTYPFHPSLISVFERKWQTLPRFQRTRGVLRLLALWISKAFEQGFKGAFNDPLITIGSAPLDDPTFRTAVFEQLGENKLDIPVTTDICGKSDSHAKRLDEAAVATIKNERLHRKVATSIFFESNGGQMNAYATFPEIRLAVGKPELDLGNIETVMDALAPPDGCCYYLDCRKNQYWFSLKPNLTKVFSDRKANIKPEDIEEYVRREIQAVFNKPVDIGTHFKPSIERIFFPDKSSDVPNQPKLTHVVLNPDKSLSDPTETENFIDQMTKNYGTSSRVYKSALIWSVSETAINLQEEARKLKTWESIHDERRELRLDDDQVKQVKQNIDRAERDLTESVWRSYRFVYLMGRDNRPQKVDLGGINSSSAHSLPSLIISRLKQMDEIADPYPSPKKIIENWNPSIKEWSTKAVRDAFYASPQLPRVLSEDAVRECIAKGVGSSLIAYVGKTGTGEYQPFRFGDGLNYMDVTISEDFYIITGDEARKYIKPPTLTTIRIEPASESMKPGFRRTFVAKCLDQNGQEMTGIETEWSATGGKIDNQGTYTAGSEEGSFIVKASCGDVSGSATAVISVRREPPPPPPRKRLRWIGEIPPQKWMNFYSKVLSRFTIGKGLKITVQFDVDLEDGISQQQVDETRSNLRDLGLHDDVEVD